MSNNYKMEEPYFWNQFHNADHYQRETEVHPSHFSHGGNVQGIPLDLKRLGHRMPTSNQASAIDAIALAKKLRNI